MGDIVKKPKTNKKVKCTKCNGTGKINNETCRKCNGKGELELLQG